MEEILLGTTDRSILVFIADPASTDGGGKTGLTHADLTVSYTRAETDNDVVVTDVTSSLSTLTNLTDAHTDWGVKEVSSTLAPGLYRLDVADAVFASGAWQAVVYVMITTSTAAATPKGFRLVAVNALDGVRFGITALPAAAADAAGGLPISDAGGLDLDALAANVAALLAISVSGTVDDAGAAAGDFDGSSGLSASDDFYNGAVLVFTSGTLQGIARKISNYTGSSQNLEFTGSTGDADAPFPAAPTNGDAFKILGRIG